MKNVTTRQPKGCRMEPSDLLVYLAGEFDRLGIDYFVTGSMATIYFGEPRLTNDVDVVVRLDGSGVWAWTTRQALRTALRGIKPRTP